MAANVVDGVEMHMELPSDGAGPAAGSWAFVAALQTNAPERQRNWADAPAARRDRPVVGPAVCYR